MQVGVGISSAGDPVTAGQLAAEQAVQQSGRPALSIVLNTENYNPEAVLSAVKRVTGDSRLIGACVPGIIVNLRLYESGVGVCTIGGDGIEAATHLQRDISEDSCRKGQELGEALLEKGGGAPGTVLIIPDGSAASIPSLMRGLYASMGPGFTYLGGGSGNNLRLHPTCQYTDEGIGSNAVAAALIRGMRFRVSIGHGWFPLEEPMMVTKARGRVVYELDSIPAVERYCALLGKCQKDDFPLWSMKHPLGLPGAGGDFIICDPVRALEDGSILFATEIPENSIGVIMGGETANLVTAAKRVMQKAMETPIAPRLVLAFDCVSRYFLMGSEFHRELEAMAKGMEADVPVIGMLSFGEISNITGPPLFYNKTIVAAAGW